MLAALPGGIAGHFGPNLRRFVLQQHHQGQVTVERIITQLQALGLAISKRQVMRLLIGRQHGFLAESRAVLRAGLHGAAWVKRAAQSSSTGRCKRPRRLRASGGRARRAPWPRTPLRSRGRCSHPAALLLADEHEMEAMEGVALR